MSSVLRPVGPEDPSIYWKRRAVVFGSAFVVLIMLWVLLFSGGGDGSANASPPSPSPSPTDTTSPEPSANASGSQSPSPSGSAAAAGASPSASPAACADSAIAVTVTTDGETFPAGAGPKTTLSIKNTGTTDCVRDIGADANEIIIESGTAHVWSSDDCDASKGSSPTVLPAGQAAQTTLTWSRTLSTPGCTTSGSPAQPGSYTVKGRNGEIISEPVRFTLQ